MIKRYSGNGANRLAFDGIRRIFGGTERITGSSFLVEVYRQARCTNINAHYRAIYIRPGSIIYSDEWKAYAGISHVNNYEHRTVNHSNFC